MTVAAKALRWGMRLLPSIRAILLLSIMLPASGLASESHVDKWTWGIKEEGGLTLWYGVENSEWELALRCTPTKDSVVIHMSPPTWLNDPKTASVVLSAPGGQVAVQGTFDFDGYGSFEMRGDVKFELIERLLSWSGMMDISIDGREAHSIPLDGTLKPAMRRFTDYCTGTGKPIIELLQPLPQRRW